MNSRSRTSGILLRRLEDRLGDAAQQCQVAADPHLHVHRADLGRVERRHVDELVRDDRPPRGRLDQRVDVHELRAAPVGLGQPGEHPRRVRSRRCRPSARSRPRAPSRPGRPCPCRCRSPPSAPGRSPRGTCSSSPAGCSSRTRAPTAGRGTSPRCSAAPRCRTTPGAGSPTRAGCCRPARTASSQEIGSYVSLAGS